MSEDLEIATNAPAPEPRPPRFPLKGMPFTRAELDRAYKNARKRYPRRPAREVRWLAYRHLLIIRAPHLDRLPLQVVDRKVRYQP